MKLNLGGGQVWKQEGWINLDKYKGYDISKKFLKGFSDNSIDVIYTSHFIEHLEHRDVFKLFKDCYRVLKYGSIIRITIPSVDELLDIVEKGDKSIFINTSNYYKTRPNLTLNNIVEELLGLGKIKFNMHKCYFSRNSIKLLLLLSGFKEENIKFVSFCKSQIEELEKPAVKTDTKGLGPSYNFDVSGHKGFSLYVESTK